MTLEQAVSHHTDTIVLNSDEQHYQQLFGQVLTSLQGIRGRVEEAELGTAYVRLDGFEVLFGGRPSLSPRRWTRSLLT